MAAPLATGLSGAANFQAPCGNYRKAGAFCPKGEQFMVNAMFTTLAPPRGYARVEPQADTDISKHREGKAEVWLMWQKIARLFVIKTRAEAFLVIFALANGAVQRGQVYLGQYPGFGGKLLFLACTGSVFMAGAKILDCIKHEAAKAEPETVKA